MVLFMESESGIKDSFILFRLHITLARNGLWLPAYQPVRIDARISHSWPERRQRHCFEQSGFSKAIVAQK
jgi:hypothetical protein